ncbi:hypothetical protein BU25DRAFT_204936 [Macroventuria anomochaeta]|uniref:Uncharacterized protein n=1 Tax=Macroventuria anomochaeta TaxID=301207 RepID=A0ACB6RP69_9PLEO|nr:uncharacterized protein BU25DRAFT_204936 [Macroventuria anomochaeta]KAF2622732.1 hypothetical protein BU25DRAFT_204936 [Macroventuria anomochaeta]
MSVFIQHRLAAWVQLLRTASLSSSSTTAYWKSTIGAGHTRVLGVLHQSEKVRSSPNGTLQAGGISSFRMLCTHHSNTLVMMTYAI